MKFTKLAKNKKTADMEKYQINSKYFDLLNTGTLRSLLNEANIILTETQDAIKSITNKSNDLFKILIVVLFALIAFLFTGESAFLVKAFAVYYILSIMTLNLMLYSIIYPKSNALNGIEPRKIIDDDMIRTNINKNEKRFLFVLIQDKQIAVDNNKLLHSKLLKQYKSVIQTMLILISISIIVLIPMCYLLTPFLNMYCHL